MVEFKKFKISSSLICITTDATEGQWKKVLEFLEWKNPREEVLCLTTCGRASYTKYFDVKKTLNDKNITLNAPVLVSTDKTDLLFAYSALEIALSFQFRERHVLFISDMPLETFFKPIQIDIAFIDEDLDELCGKTNEDILVEFVLAMRASPKFVIYDASLLQFVTTQTTL